MFWTSRGRTWELGLDVQQWVIGFNCYNVGSGRTLWMVNVFIGPLRLTHYSRPSPLAAVR